MYTLFATLNALIGAIGVPINIVIIYICVKTRHIKEKVGNLLILNMAIVDLFNSATCCQVCSAFMFSPNSYHLVWIGNSLFILSISLSLMAFLMAAVERCIAICAPFKHRNYVNICKMRIVIAIYSLLMISGSTYYGFVAYQSQLTGTHYLASPDKIEVVFNLPMLTIITTLNVVTYFGAKKSINVNVNAAREIKQSNERRIIAQEKEKRLFKVFMYMQGIL